MIFRHISLITGVSTLVPRLQPGNALPGGSSLLSNLLPNHPRQAGARNSLASKAGAWEPDTGDKQELSQSISLWLVTFACLMFAGCDRVLNSSNGPVAVVDLDAVAQKIGKDKQMLQMIEQRQVSLNEQVIAAQNSLIQQLNQKKIEFGELSDEESKQLVQLQNQANSILATTRTQAQSNLTSFQQEVVERFRNQIKPIAMELAARKGCRVVLSKNDSVVFAFDATVDLTDEVTAYMQTKVSASQSSAAQVKQAAVQTNAKLR